MSKSADNSAKGKTNEEIFAGFQNLRAEQRQLANKISELEMDLNEHKIVIETLQGVEPARKCFRMVGGVLAERTVADVLPQLQTNCDHLPKALQALHEQLSRKGAEINEYIEQHNIHVQRADRDAPAAPPPGAPAALAAPAKTTVLVPSD